MTVIRIQGPRRTSSRLTALKLFLNVTPAISHNFLGTTVRSVWDEFDGSTGVNVRRRGVRVELLQAANRLPPLPVQ